MERRFKSASDLLTGRLFQSFAVSILLSGLVIVLSDNRLHHLRVIGTLVATPGVLVVSGPFVKLSTRVQGRLKRLLRQLVRRHNLRLVLILSERSRVPSFVARILPIRSGIIKAGVRGVTCTPVPDVYVPSRLALPPTDYRSSCACTMRNIISFQSIALHCNGHIVFRRLD